MATLNIVDPFVTLLINAAGKGSGLRVVLHNRERVLVDFKGKPYLFIFINATTELTPGKVKRRVLDWQRIKNKNVSGHIVISRHSELSPTLISLDGINLPSKIAVVGDWSGKNQLVTSQIDGNMAHLLELIGISKGEIARSRKPRVVKKGFRRGGDAPRPEEPGPTQVMDQRNLRKDAIIDAYQIEKKLGQGASAEVWCATVTRLIPGVELRTGQKVAVKFYTILPHGSQTIRIQREFDLGATAGHKHLARVFDLVISPSRPFHNFMVMEFVDGPTLKAHISSIGQLSSLNTALIGIQLFEGLAELHSLEALHRDVKAANIMLSRSNGDDLEIKLVDLGIISVANDTRLTAHSSFLGSKHSAPMEQLIGKELDQRTDIYRAGSVLFHCLQGKPMYDGAGPEAAIVIEMLSAPEQLKPRTDMSVAEEALITFINSCIAVKKEERPKDCDECLKALRQIHASLQSDMAPASPKPAVTMRPRKTEILFSLHFDQPVGQTILSEARQLCDDWLRINDFKLIGFSRNPQDPAAIDLDVLTSVRRSQREFQNIIDLLKNILIDLPLKAIRVERFREFSE